jgi:hypothetical protein
VPPKDFSELSDDEAEAYFASYTEAVPARAARLRAEVGEDTLDFSPESLVPAWEWFVRREDGRADRDGELPPWYEPDPPESAAGRLSPATLRDVDALAAYLAEVFLRSVAGAEWGIGKLPKRMEYEAQNKPVLRLPGAGEADPVGVAYSLAVRVALLGGGREPDTLLGAYRAWTAG